MKQAVTPELLVRAYMNGAFPMAEPETGEVMWFCADPRSIVPLDGTLHVSRTLNRTIRKGIFDIRTDTAFDEVIRACARDRSEDNRNWISPEMIAAYNALHVAKLAHSVEAWRDGKLVGGLYGVSLGGAFFGESMFCRPEIGGTDASKMCLVALVARLRAGGFILCDSQYSNAHMDRFGVRELAADAYRDLLHDALELDAKWDALAT
ncbi:MAG: leucyl/phenylalanyl-tRNA--protein transferase, partial [Phycisphaerae bacterium]|nr:leucyl/phenylalanyl-tRNA--protein transferase [Phycisphaerae bacterium]